MKSKLSLLASAMLLATQVNAHQVENSFDVAAMAQDANAVFHGKVIAVDYRGSKATKGQAPLPHTFVTFEVQDVLYGNPSVTNRKTFTIRFLGGAAEDGRLMLIDVHPKFDVGDEDVLFVTGNGVADCPLVECANGRFRVVDDMMYNEHGQKVMLKEHSIVLGSSVENSVFNTHKVGDITLKRTSNRSQGEGGTSSETQDKGQHLDLNTFLNLVSERIANDIPSDPHGENKVANNVDKNSPFSFKPAEHGKPVSVKDSVIKPTAKTVQERKELEAAQRNDGDPVLR